MPAGMAGRVVPGWGVPRVPGMAHNPVYDGPGQYDRPGQSQGQSNTGVNWVQINNIILVSFRLKVAVLWKTLEYR